MLAARAFAQAEYNSTTELVYHKETVCVKGFSLFFAFFDNFLEDLVLGFLRFRL